MIMHVRNALMALGLALSLHSPVFAAAGVQAGDTRPAADTLDSCSWNHPGVNPFMGDVVDAVDRYPDIPQDVRQRLKARIAKRTYDDLVSIRRDSISGDGGYDYGSDIRDMHFGTSRLCHSVTRSAWTPSMEERGLVYCESGHCILIPTVCRNVSRISRKAVDHAAAKAPMVLAEVAVAPGAPADDPGLPEEGDPIAWFGPTGAGTPSGVETPDGSGFASAGGGFASLGGGFAALGGASGGTAGAASGFGTSANHNSLGRAAPAYPSSAGSAAAIAAVPEPQTWSMMVGGLVACGLMSRRTRRAGGARR